MENSFAFVSTSSNSQAIRYSEICLFRLTLSLRGMKLFLDTVTKSLGLLLLPWSQRQPHHIQWCAMFGNGWGALTDWVITDIVECCTCKWWITSLFGQYTGLYVTEFGQQFSVKWWKLKRSQLNYSWSPVTKPSTPTSFSDVVQSLY